MQYISGSAWISLWFLRMRCFVQLPAPQCGWTVWKGPSVLAPLQKPGGGFTLQYPLWTPDGVSSRASVRATKTHLASLSERLSIQWHVHSKRFLLLRFIVRGIDMVYSASGCVHGLPTGWNTQRGYPSMYFRVSMIYMWLNFDFSYSTGQWVLSRHHTLHVRKMPNLRPGTTSIDSLATLVFLFPLSGSFISLHCVSLFPCHHAF